MTRPKILVHICCAPDAAYVVALLQRDFEVVGVFFNPNIHPREEYFRRLEEARKVACSLNIQLIEEPYEDALWLELTQKYKDEPEKGRRCEICYAIRLERTGRRAAELHLDAFTTVMSLSPWKRVEVINRLGKLYGEKHGLRFLEADFKKKDGFRKSVSLSRELGLYRQDYCGCLYSLRARKSRSGPEEEGCP